MNKETNELKVFISNRNSVCGECSSALGRRAWIVLCGDAGALCLSCADLDHLVFLPSGDAALTRRSKRHSTLHAVVLKWSRARKRYERQGLLVEEEALVQAEKECLDDAEFRMRRQEREAERRAEIDAQYVEEFAAQIRRQFPSCPSGRDESIAEFACLKYSGRVGRSAAAKQFDEEPVRLAVIAHIRHTETDYDALLARGIERNDCRDRVRERVDDVLGEWSQMRS